MMVVVIFDAKQMSPPIAEGATIEATHRKTTCRALSSAKLLQTHTQFLSGIDSMKAYRILKSATHCVVPSSNLVDAAISYYHEPSAPTVGFWKAEKFQKVFNEYG